MDTLKGLLIAVALFLGIADILLVAEIAAPERKCAINFYELLCALSARDTLSAGLIAAAGAIFAAWLAWAAVQRQERRDDRARIRRLIGLARLIESELLMMAGRAIQLGRHFDYLDEFLGTISEQSVIEVADIESHLAAVLATHIVEVGRFREMHASVRKADEGHGLVQRFPAGAREFAARSELLAACFEQAARRLEAGQDIPVPLLDERRAMQIMSNHTLTSRQAGYVGILTALPEE